MSNQWEHEFDKGQEKLIEDLGVSKELIPRISDLRRRFVAGDGHFDSFDVDLAMLQDEIPIDITQFIFY